MGIIRLSGAKSRDVVQGVSTSLDTNGRGGNIRTPVQPELGRPGFTRPNRSQSHILPFSRHIPMASEADVKGR